MQHAVPRGRAHPRKHGLQKGSIPASLDAGLIPNFTDAPSSRRRKLPCTQRHRLYIDTAWLDRSDCQQRRRVYTNSCRPCQQSLATFGAQNLVKGKVSVNHLQPGTDSSLPSRGSRLQEHVARVCRRRKEGLTGCTLVRRGRTAEKFTNACARHISAQGSHLIRTSGCRLAKVTLRNALSCRPTRLVHKCVASSEDMYEKTGTQTKAFSLSEITHTLVVQIEGESFPHFQRDSFKFCGNMFYDTARISLVSSIMGTSTVTPFLCGKGSPLADCDVVPRSRACEAQGAHFIDVDALDSS